MKKKLLIAILALAVFAQQAWPADLLQQVVIVTRHGVRAPTWTPERLNQYSAAQWPDFSVPPGYLTPHGRALMKLMGEFYWASRHQIGCHFRARYQCIKSIRHARIIVGAAELSTGRRAAKRDADLHFMEIV